MALAKVFRSGNSQAVRLPKEFRLAADEVEISRQGDNLLLSPRPHDMARFVELLFEMSDDVFEGIRDERVPQEREGL